MKTILVADDDSTVRTLIVDWLQDEGFRTIGTYSCQEAVDIAVTEFPDLVIMDVMFGHDRLGGIKACKRLKEREDTKGIPVIFISNFGRAGDEIAQELRGIERMAWFDKPVDMIELAQKISNMLHSTDSGVNENHSRQPVELTLCSDEHDRPSADGLSKKFPLAEVSQLTASIVHDVRSGLGVIRNTIGFLEDEFSSPKHQSDFLKIARSLDFCELVLRNLSALGEEQIAQLHPVNLETIVREVYSMFERKLVDVRLVIDVDASVPDILVDEGQMKQVFMNLIKNAGEAMPNGGTLTVRTWHEGEMLRIEVSDTGCGISSENQTRLFREFFTTKEQGYGLGLHIVHTIIERHGGTIDVESRQGEGTTFVIRLPIDIGTAPA